jgi:hypothetical protein
MIPPHYLGKLPPISFADHSSDHIFLIIIDSLRNVINAYCVLLILTAFAYQGSASHTLSMT